MAEGDPLFEGGFVKLSESRRLFIGSKSDTWKSKHIVLRRKGDKLVLEYHKKKQKSHKKGEHTLTNSFELWPTFKVEKLTNARGRAFVCEITAPDIHQFLSSDIERDIDVFVFLLQSQITLKENLREDIVSVLPDESESQTKIGAKGSQCFLHISPWGITLALEKSRALLAQWPLKSIRYYETSGNGHFTIEAGRVAPMGEGVFGFRTAVGEDDKTYDLVDNYIVNTLDRVKPSQRGTQKEIEDYIREHDFLHSLTMVKVRPKSDPEVTHALKQCWNIGSGVDTQQQRNDSRDAQTPSSPGPPASTTQTSSLNITLERSNGQGSSNTFPSDARSSKRPSLVNDSKSSTSDGRPPLPGRAARRSRRRDHSLPRKIDVAQSSSSDLDDTISHNSLASQRQSGASVVADGSRTPELPSKQSQSSSLLFPDSVQPLRDSNPSNVLHQVNTQSNQSLSPLAYQNQSAEHQRTEFYNLNSPNLKVRVSKSPLVTRNPNKVGRAEYLLSVQESGVRSPSPEGASKGGGRWDISPNHHSSEEESQDIKRYMDAIARESKKKFAGHNSLDRNWNRVKREVSAEGERQSLQLESLNFDSKPSQGVGGYVNAPKPSGGYINLNKNSSGDANLGKEKCNLQDRQSSVESFTSALSRQNSLKIPSSPPPVVHHHRQRSAPVDTDWSPAGYQGSPLIRKKVATSIASHEDSGVSLRSRNSQLSSDDGLSRDSAHSIGSFKSAASRQNSGFSTLDQTESTVTNWLMSASCEDLSDHMRHVIFQDDEDGEKADNPEEYESTYEEIHNTEDSVAADTSVVNSPPSSDDKPPLPFTGLKKFQNNGNVRDRSKSFGYMNIPQGTKDSPDLLVKQPSSAPSAHLIRKMVSARAKQETLRKSLSNPNFLNLGSKEQLFKLKINSRNMATSSGNLSANGEKLESASKSKSRSFSNLFPAIKKALSRESIGAHSRSTTPERRSSLRNSFSLRRRSSERDITLRRQNSLHTPGEMTIKGIRMTTRSRSFRRVRGTKSVEGLSSMLDSDLPLADDILMASPAVHAENPESQTSSNPEPQLTTSQSSTSIKSIPDHETRRKSAPSVQMRSSSSSISIKTLPPNHAELRKNSLDAVYSSQIKSSPSSSSIKTQQETTNSRKSNHSSSMCKSDQLQPKTNPSYSANYSITLSSPQYVSSVSTISASSQHSHPPSVSISSRGDKPPDKPAIVQSETPPPPIPPRQKINNTLHSSAKPPPSSSSSNYLYNSKGKFSKTKNNPSPSNYMNAELPMSPVKSHLSSYSTNVNSNSQVRNNNEVQPYAQADVVNCTSKGSFQKKDNSSDNTISSITQQNGDRSRPTRHKVGLDKVSPKS